MQRRAGYPRSDIERAARHYALTYDEAERQLSAGLITLPQRGYGLETGRAAGTTSGINPVLLIITGIVCVAAVGFAIYRVATEIRAQRAVVKIAKVMEKK